MLSTSVLITAGVAHLLIGLLSISIYRLWFHPLSKHPGPWLGKITDWYTIYHIVKGDPHVNLYNLHAKYGPIVRYGPNRVAINTSTALRDIYDAKANTTKGNYYTVFGHFFREQCTLTTVNRVEHGTKRRVLEKALSPSFIKGMEPNILRNVRIFCDAIKDIATTDDPLRMEEPRLQSVHSSSNIVDIASWTARLTFDLMGEICFSKSFNMLSDSRHRWFLRALPEAIKCLYITAHMPLLTTLPLDWMMPKLCEDVRSYEQFGRIQTKERIGRSLMMQSAHAPKDTFSHLLAGRDPTAVSKETLDQLVSEAALLVIAGSDTTSSCIATTLTYLTRYPTKLQTLANEIRNTFHALEDIKSSSQLYSCTYLRACINEGLRIAPVIGGALPREVLKGGITIDGEHFPEGTILGTGSYAIHHNEYYFSRPFNYEPERWLEEYQGERTGRTVEEIDRAQSAFKPFGVGPWNCAGKHMALSEVSLIIARLVWLFNMETPDPIQVNSLNGKQRKWDYLDIMKNRGEIPSEDKFVAKYEKMYIKFSLRVV